jgi:hypothetical protein
MVPKFHIGMPQQKTEAELQPMSNYSRLQPRQDLI